MRIYEILAEQAPGEMSVEKDTDQETVLVDKAKGTKTVIDKKNPNAPKLTQDQQGKFQVEKEPPGQAAKKLPIPAGTKVAVQQNQ
jgi:hypothetical protein